MTGTSAMTLAAASDPLPGLMAIWVIVDVAVILIVVFVARRRRRK